jgi:hypothetical protein
VIGCPGVDWELLRGTRAPEFLQILLHKLH